MNWLVLDGTVGRLHTVYDEEAYLDWWPDNWFLVFCPFTFNGTKHYHMQQLPFNWVIA